MYSGLLILFNGPIFLKWILFILILLIGQLRSSSLLIIQSWNLRMLGDFRANSNLLLICPSIIYGVYNSEELC